MKKIIPFILTVALSFLVAGCLPDTKVSFDENLILGEWVSGTMHYKYAPSYTGGKLLYLADV